MPRTNGGNNIFEGRITSKSKIVKIHWKYLSFLTPQNLHVRATTGNVNRAERCKMEEIGLMQELLNFVGNMFHFWQTGSKTIRFVSSGAQSAKARILLL